MPPGQPARRAGVLDEDDMISWVAAIALGVATTAEASILSMSDYATDQEGYTLAPGLFAVYIVQPKWFIHRQVIFFGVNTAFWSCTWRQFPTFARKTCWAMATNTAFRFGASFFPKK